MEIRKASFEDIIVIQKLAEIIWPTAYYEIITKEQLRYMLDLIYNKDALTKQIQSGHQFIIAIDDGVEIGFASYSQKNKGDTNIFRLHKIYVLPNQPVKGIGSFLLDAVILDSKKNGANSLELNVNKYNSAIQFYKKKEFTIIKEEVIDIGNGYIMDDYVMEKKL
jgi:diamine N-acetyltransferase